LNTPRVITDQQQRVVWRWENQEPFGNSPPEENPSGLGEFTFPLRFSGQYFDRETNTSYNYFRDYDPATGRYVQSDPIGLAGGLNTYGYANQNPLSFVDPSGLFFGKGGAGGRAAKIPPNILNQFLRADPLFREQLISRKRPVNTGLDWARDFRPPGELPFAAAPRRPRAAVRRRG